MHGSRQKRKQEKNNRGLGPAKEVVPERNDLQRECDAADSVIHAHLECPETETGRPGGVVKRSSLHKLGQTLGLFVSGVVIVHLQEIYIYVHIL